jgi:hypothetical protein
MTTLRQQGIPALPLHDALIVREGDREVAVAALIGGYERLVGSRQGSVRCGYSCPWRGFRLPLIVATRYTGDRISDSL